MYLQSYILKEKSLCLLYKVSLSKTNYFYMVKSVVLVILKLYKATKRRILGYIISIAIIKISIN